MYQERGKPTTTGKVYQGEIQSHIFSLTG